MGDWIKSCHDCRNPWEGSPGSSPGKAETCPHCGADLHCCLNCRLYDPSASRECRSRTVEHVKDKDRRNFCDEFVFSEKGAGSPSDGGSPSEMDKKWKDLFGG